MPETPLPAQSKMLGFEMLFGERLYICKRCDDTVQRTGRETGTQNSWPNEYDRYRRSGRKEQAQRLWRDWAKGRGKERLDKNGRVTPSVSTFERYLRDF